MWAKTTIGVDAGRPLRSPSNHSSCSLPRLPRPPALRSTTLTRPMKCTPFGVEAIPARAFGAATVAVAVELHALVENVVFARHIMHVEPGLRDDAVGIVEFGRLGEMGDIAGMNDEGWLHAKRLDLADRFLERAEGVG